MTKLTLSVLKEKFSVCKFNSQDDIPEWLSKTQCQFLSVTKTAEELSIVCDQSIVPEQLEAAAPVVKDWRILKVEGALDFR